MIEKNTIEDFILMIENVGYKLFSSERKVPKFNTKLKTIDTFIYKDFKEEEMTLYKSTSVYNSVLWTLYWRDYKQVLTEGTIVIFLNILKTQYNNRLRKVKIQSILNGTFEQSFDRASI